MNSELLETKPMNRDHLPLLVLASESPRRAELLEKLGLPFVVRPARLDETGLAKGGPGESALQLALAKAEACWSPGEWTVGADTVVALDQKVLGKPKDLQENHRFLAMLSGRAHTVYTGLALVSPKGERRRHLEEARVFFRALSAWELEWYARSGEGLDKAGGYGAQGLGMVLVEKIEGDFFTVMGLPVSALWKALGSMGYFGGGR